MSIWLWVVIFLTWCAFLFTFFRLSAFTKLNQHVRNLEKVKREDENYIEEKHKELSEWSEVYAKQTEVLNEWSEALNEWVEAYNFQSDQLDHSLDMIEEWFALDIDRRKFDSFAEVDDLLLKTTTKEFIRLEASARASEVKAKQTVVNINLHKNLLNIIDDMSDKFKKIEGHFSDDGFKDIDKLIEVEKGKFLNEKERSTDIS